MAKMYLSLIHRETPLPGTATGDCKKPNDDVILITITSGNVSTGLNYQIRKGQTDVLGIFRCGGNAKKGETAAFTKL